MLILTSHEILTMVWSGSRKFDSFCLVKLKFGEQEWQPTLKEEDHSFGEMHPDNIFVPRCTWNAWCSCFCSMRPICRSVQRQSFRLSQCFPSKQANLMLKTKVCLTGQVQPDVHRSSVDHFLGNLPLQNPAKPGNTVSLNKGSKPSCLESCFITIINGALTNIVDVCSWFWWWHSTDSNWWRDDVFLAFDFCVFMT